MKKNREQDIYDENIILFLDYLKYERRVSINTVNSYENNLRMLLSFFDKNILLLNKDDIKKFISELKLTSRTKAHYLSVFNSFYNFMVFNGKIKTNPCENIKSPKIAKNLPKYLL